MNEAETRVELIDLKVEGCGWGVVEDAKLMFKKEISKSKQGFNKFISI